LTLSDSKGALVEKKGKGKQIFTQQNKQQSFRDDGIIVAPLGIRFIVITKVSPI
jgi:hypothetical protein